MKGICARVLGLAVVGLVVVGMVVAAGAARSERTFAGKNMILDEDPWWTNREFADKALDRIQNAGFNAYSPMVWHGRGATWPTKLAPRDPWLRALPTTGYDPLEELIRKAHTRGIEVHPWFNVVLRQSDLRPELALPGEAHPDEGAFDVHDPRFREWMSDLVAEVAANYDVDGVMLDYMRAVMLCLTETCKQEYRKKYKRSLAADALLMQTKFVSVPTLIQYQERAVTALLQRIAHKVRKKKPNILLSVDAIPGYAGPEQGQNSVEWANQGLIDVIFRMDYYLKIDVGLTDSIRKQLRRPDALSVLISNISHEEREPDQPHFPRPGKWVADTVSLVRQKWPNTGTAIYFYKSLSDEQIAALKAGPFRTAEGVLEPSALVQVR